jgi:hypothetical protein
MAEDKQGALRQRIIFGQQCHHGIESDSPCPQRPVWVTTFDGVPTGWVWCEEHKPLRVQPGDTIGGIAIPEDSPPSLWGVERCDAAEGS